MKHCKGFGLFVSMSVKHFVLAVWLIGTLASCSTLEKASVHGLNSGYYKMKSDVEDVREVYVDIQGEKMEVYQHTSGQVDENQFLTIPLDTADSSILNPIVFKKQSLDVDITSVVMKYRPSVSGLPAQLTTDLNMALYVGWRHDYYRIKSKKDPLGRSYPKIDSRGCDFGFFAGPGATLISPFTTLNRKTDEYSGMVMQAGIAGFIESNVASFGLAVGYDYLLNSDRSIWIYNNQPWAGLIVGIALN